jgi:hypothetical protein
MLITAIARMSKLAAKRITSSAQKMLVFFLPSEEAAGVLAEGAEAVAEAAAEAEPAVAEAAVEAETGVFIIFFFAEAFGIFTFRNMATTSV